MKMKSPLSEIIENFSLLEKVYGYEPQNFEDGTIQKVELSVENDLSVMKLFILGDWDLENQNRITLIFTNLRDLKLENFSYQNVISFTKITKKNDNLFVELNAAIGVWGSFYCEKITVDSVDPI